MTLPRRAFVPALGAILLSASLSSCIFAAAGGAGGGFYFTNRGAEGVLEGTLDGVTRAAHAAFRRLSMDSAGQREVGDSATEREVYAKAGDDDVTVILKRETDSTVRVEVRVRRTAVTWDKDMARKVLEAMDDVA